MNLIDTLTKCKRIVSKVQIEYIVIAETRMLVSAEFGKQKPPNSQFWRRWKYIKSAKLQQQLHCRKSFCLSRISSCQSWFSCGKKSLLMKRNIWRVQMMTMHYNGVGGDGDDNMMVIMTILTRILTKDATSCWEISGEADIGQQALLGWQHRQPGPMPGQWQWWWGQWQIIFWQWWWGMRMATTNNGDDNMARVMMIALQYGWRWW